jgi:hypothetical protein
VNVPDAVAKKYWTRVIPHTDGCWGWAGSTAAGYGWIGLKSRGSRRSYNAHRVAYELRVGDIPEGMCVPHRCDNRRCSRPDHLFLGTKQDNSRDMVAKGRHRPGGRLWRKILEDEDGED